MIIGLTGGIATGKSNVSSCLAEHGYAMVNADQVTHEVQAAGQPGLKAIIKKFGDQYLTSKNTLDRHKLGQMVFSHPQALKELVRVIDPYIRATIIRRIKTLQEQGHSKIVLEAPTLFESGYQYLADKLVVVACRPEVQLQRLCRRDGFDRKAAQERIDAQWPLKIKKALADVVIDSNGSIDQTRQQVIKLMHAQIF